MNATKNYDQNADERTLYSTVPFYKSIMSIHQVASICTLLVDNCQSTQHTLWSFAMLLIILSKL